MSIMSVFLAIAWLNVLANWSGTFLSPNPKDCLKNSTLNGLISCLDAFTVYGDFYDASSYNAAQPTSEQTDAWMSVVASMLNADTENCTNIPLPLPLADNFGVTAFLDAASDRTFCVLSETTATNGNYTKGWGVMIVPAKDGISRTLHLSAPHPQADINTPQQAAAIFVLSGARSLLISGRFRSAYSAPTDCITPSNPNTVYYRTDPAHDVNEPFNVANRVIREWQNSHGGCPSETCAYVQIHGKSSSTCSTDTMFISSGLGTSNSSIAWYENTGLDIPARRLRDAARAAFPTWNASLPSNDMKCDLTATTNVFGRLINGIPESNVCTQEANSTTATGQFIHIEQALISRQSDVYEQWGEVIRQTFRTSCAEGMKENVVTGLCVPV